MSTNQKASVVIVDDEEMVITSVRAYLELETEFEIHAEIREIEVCVARRKSIRIDNQLTGTAWIDSVGLQKLR